MGNEKIEVHPTLGLLYMERQKQGHLCLDDVYATNIFIEGGLGIYFCTYFVFAGNKHPLLSRQQISRLKKKAIGLLLVINFHTTSWENC